MLYSSGLRVSELVNLKVKDVNVQDNLGWVRKGKGSKDRMFIIASSLKDDIKKFIGSKKLNEFDYLFTSTKGRKYNTSSPRQIIKKSAELARINKKVSCHTLRHSFATHLIENVYSVSKVQALLGQKARKQPLFMFMLLLQI